MKLDFLKFDIQHIDLSKINLNQLKSIKAIAILFVIILCVINLCLALPLLQRIKKVGDLTQQDIQEVGAVNALLSKESLLTNTRLFAIEGIDQLFDEISKIAVQAGVEVNIDIKVDKDPDDSQPHAYARKVLRMDAAGSFKNLGVFLTAIHRMPEAILGINRIDISRSTKDPAQVEAHINFILFALKDD